MDEAETPTGPNTVRPRPKRRVYLIVAAVTVAVLLVGIAVAVAVNGSSGEPDDTSSSSDGKSDEADGIPKDVLPKGITVADRGMSRDVGPEGQDLFYTGAVFENTSKHPIAMSVTYTVGSTKADKDGEKRPKLTFPEEEPTPPYITVLPGQKTGAGEFFETEDAPSFDGIGKATYLQIRGTATKADSGNGQKYEGLDKMVLDHPDDAMTAKVTRVTDVGEVDFEVENTYPEAIADAGIGVVKYAPDGSIVGGFIARDADDATYETGTSQHSRRFPVAGSDLKTADIKVFIWP